DRRVIAHVMKNAAPSVMALMGLQLGYLLGGSILVETVFNWPGSGGLMNLAIFRRDVPVLSATILTIATLFVLINIAVGLLQAAVAPRMRRWAGCQWPAPIPRSRWPSPSRGWPRLSPATRTGGTSGGGCAGTR